MFSFACVNVVNPFAPRFSIVYRVFSGVVAVLFSLWTHCNVRFCWRHIFVSHRYTLVGTPTQSWLERPLRVKTYIREAALPHTTPPLPLYSYTAIHSYNTRFTPHSRMGPKETSYAYGARKAAVKFANCFGAGGVCCRTRIVIGLMCEYKPAIPRWFLGVYVAITLRERLGTRYCREYQVNCTSNHQAVVYK